MQQGSISYTLAVQDNDGDWWVETPDHRWQCVSTRGEEDSLLDLIRNWGPLQDVK